MKTSTTTKSSSEKRADTDLGNIQPGTFVRTRVAGTGEAGTTLIENARSAVFFPTDTTRVAVRGDSLAEDRISDNNAVGVSDLYPHWEEGRTDAGIAVRFVSLAVKDLQQAIEMSDDMSPEFLNHMVLAETSLFQTLSKAHFNKAFASVIDFCAWGIRNAAFESPNKPSLEGLCSALRELQEQPFVDMNRATDIVLELENQGWSGESPISQAFREGMPLADTRDRE